MSKQDLEFLDSLEACESGMRWVESTCKGSIKTAWRMCKRSDWTCWFLNSLGADDKTMRLLACRFVRETPLADGRKVWDLLTDERSRNGVVVAERFAEGKATREERDAARDAARAAAGTAAWDAARAAAWAAAGTAARDAARDAAWAAAWAAAGDAARDAAWAAAGTAAWDAVWDAQCKIIRAMVPWVAVEKMMEAKRK